MLIQLESEGMGGVSDGSAQGVLLMVNSEVGVLSSSEVGVLSSFFAELGLFPVSILFTDFVAYRNSFALRQFSADFAILYTHFSEGWIAREGVY